MAITLARRACWLCVSLVVAATAVAGVHAQSVSGGLTVAPAIKQISLLRDQSSASFTLQVTNHAAQAVSLAVTARNFTTLDQNGGIRFLNAATADGAHELASFMTIATPYISIAPGKTIGVPVSIDMAGKLAAGGHYAAVVFRVASPSRPGDNVVSTTPAVSSLVFVTSYGAGTQELTLATPVIGSLYARMPDSLDVVFTNTGNTQTTVRGVAQVTDASGKPVSQGLINADSGLILPDSQRLFNVSLQPQSNALQLVGQYTLHVLYRHDGQDKYTVYEAKFFYVNAAIAWSSLPFAVICIAIVVRVARRCHAKR